MKNIRQVGSSIILVVCFMSVVMLILAAACRNSSLVCDVALQRTMYEQRQVAGQGLLNCLICVAQENYDRMIALAKPLEINNFQWPIGTQTLKGLGQVKPDKTALKLRVALLENESPVFCVSCNMAQVQQPNKLCYEITNWRIESHDSSIH